MYKRLLLSALVCWSVGGQGQSQDPFGGAPDAQKVRRSSGRVERLKPSKPPTITKSTQATQQIQVELFCHTSVNFNEVPLWQAMQKISKAHKIPILIDSNALENEGIDSEVRVSLNLKNVLLRSVLRLMLRDIGLDYVIKDDVLQITTKNDVERKALIRIYSLSTHSKRSDDLAAAIQKSLDAKHRVLMPRPVVQLVRSADASDKGFDIFVEANKSMHSQVERILKAFNASPSSNSKRPEQ